MSRAARPQLRQYVPRTARARLHASVYGPTIHPRLDIGRLVKALRTLVADVCQTDLEENGPNCRLDPLQISARRASNLFIDTLVDYYLQASSRSIKFESPLEVKNIYSFLSHESIEDQPSESIKCVD